MNLTIMTMINFLLFISMMSFFIMRKKILMYLLSLEFILLNIFFMTIITFSMMNVTLSYSIFILVLGACEASLGLSMVINMTRFTGNDMLTKKYLKSY
uniref:NADH-ubiquinone oxidoreductase chain 4L n=1 Tax=Watersipora subtorquata TaxID=193294 RepID=C4MEF9_9BILA|nr:NADH dehydrogenase subunit 4L [Watersipora subtorquata]ABY55227.1 NADH dehydrogenase subunit 4L [Watersipora subtorquata]